MILYPILIPTDSIGIGDYSFGSCSRESPDPSWELNDMEENVWYSVSPPSATSGGLKDITHDGFGKLTITKPGKYYISWVLVLPYEDGGLDYGQFGGEPLEDCVETAVKVNGEIILQNEDHIDLNEIIGSNCIVEIGEEEVIDINIRTIIPAISTVIMDTLYLETIEITPGLKHHFPSTYL